MSIRDSKEKAIKEIMDLRTLIDEARDEDSREKAQKQLNKIQDIVFGM